VDDVKTDYSRDDVPLDPRLAEVLLQWRSVSIFPRGQDWPFANPVTGTPYHQESLQKSQIKRAAKLAGLGQDIGWHTFRHSYRSWLCETGAPMKVRQELMRHASIQTTNVYGRATTETKRRANSQVVGLVFGSQLAGIALRSGHCDRTVNCSLFPLGDHGDLPEVTKSRKLLKNLVAGAGFEPATFGL
jgi:integrase